MVLNELGREGSGLGVELDLDLKGIIKTCCNNSGAKKGFEFLLDANLSGSIAYSPIGGRIGEIAEIANVLKGHIFVNTSDHPVLDHIIIGKNEKKILNLVDGEKKIEYKIKAIEIKQGFSLGLLSPSLSTKISSSAKTGCNFEKPQIEVKGQVKLAFNDSIEEELGVIITLLDSNNNIVTREVRAEAKLGWFGESSYNFEISSNKNNRNDCYKSNASVRAFVDIFGNRLSPYDNPLTTEVEVGYDFLTGQLITQNFIEEQKQCKKVSPVSLAESNGSLRALNSEDVSPYSSPEDAIARIEDFLYNQSQNLIQKYERQSSVCAKVTIKIDQDAVMTRATFLGNLEISNGNSANLENLSVTLQIKDANGNIVNDLFGITSPILSNITAVDGTGILTGDDPNTPQDEGIGSAKWTFIPTNLAAPEIPIEYSIGGTLAYQENGKTITVPLLSAPITVYPQAELSLDYFQSRNVSGDDPFTDPIEPSVPFDLAILVQNQGKGDAKNLSITSAQPKIVENEKGLLIDFQIIGSQVNGTDVSPSLKVDFGTIKAGQTAVADWLLKSSLQGKFIDYKATFEHTNSLGKAELSLIKEVNIHELIHQVRAADDSLPDFLVNDTFDAKFTPDTLYFSSGGTAPVKAVKNAAIDAAPSLNDLTVQISATVDTGWTYFEIAEPSNSQFDIVKIQRADATQINLDNIWTTDRTFPGTGRPTYENILHFLDNTSAGTTTYSVTYIPGGPSVTDIIDVSPDPRATAVNAISVDFSEAIAAISFDYNDISLTVNGGSNLINSTISVLALSPTRYQISGLSPLTNIDGNYSLTVNASGIQDTSGKLGIGSLSETWIKAATGIADTTPPVVSDIINLLINPRNQPVPSISVTFSEKIDLSTFNFQDITLTRNGSANLINNSVTIAVVDDTTYRINGLSAITTPDGIYTLTVNGGGIQDLSGNAGIGTQTETWLTDTIAPSAPNILSVSDLTPNKAGLQPASIYELIPLTASGQQRINTTTPTISGDLGETGLKVFYYDKITNQLLKQATVIGQQFSSSVSLPSPGARELDIQVQDAAGNTTTTTLSLFVDTASPVLTQFLNVPTSSPDPINSVDVQFSEQINLNSFDKSDLTLARDGTTIALPNSVTVAYLSDTAYRISGLANLTNSPGTYSLKVDATTIQDNAGNSGDAAKTTNFIITAPLSPGIALTQTGGNTTVTEGGNNDTYSLVLKTQPTSDVTIALSAGNQITLDKTSLTFSAANWNTPQTVTVSAVDDTFTEGSQTATINHTVSSGDIAYNGLTLPALNVGIQDNDAEIKGTVWNDLDGNALDNNEPNLAGWTVYLDSNNNNQLDGGETSTQSDSSGNYAFPNLRPGTYSVAQIVQEDWKQTYPILNISTTASDFALTIPTLDLIASSDSLVQLNFNAANYIVQEDGTAVTEIWVTRTGDTSSAVSATLSFIDGTAKGCGCAASSVNNDFNNTPLTVSFAANETNKLIYAQNALLGNPSAIRIRNDSKVEGDEFFSIKLSNPTGGATIGSQGTATVTILDDESPSNLPVTPPLESPGTPISSAGDSNALSLIGLNQFWQDSRFANIKGQGLSAVIIDTGIDLNHPFFGFDANQDGIADKIIYQYDFADGDTDASDRNNHGSHIASIVSSVAPDANLIVLKVFKDSGSGAFSDLEKALQWVYSNASRYHIASVNLSLGDSQNWATQTARYGIGDELAAIASQNIIISAAAGNSFYQSGSAQGLAYPAIDPSVIAVGAVWADSFGNNKTFSGGAIDYSTNSDRIASFSQRDSTVTEVFAPGILITGANATGGTISMGGTSQSAPYLTGIATLAQEIAQATLGRQLNVSEFRTLLANTSDLIVDGDDENDNIINTGATFPRLNIFRLADRIFTLGSAAEPIIGGISIGTSGGGTSPMPSSLSQSHTVNLLSGQVVIDLNFGNQVVLMNQPPTAVALTNTIASLAENTNTSSRIKLTDIAISDDALGSNSISLQGVDAAAFEVDGTALFLNAGTSLNYETKTAYAVTVSVGDTTIASASPVSTDYNFAVTDVNEAPTAVALTNTTASLPENTNTTSRIKVADIAISDDALGTNSISLLGTDAAAFELDGTALFLKAGTSLNYETKTAYAVTVSVGDTTISGSSPVSTDYNFAVTDVNESPAAVALTNVTATLAENTNTSSRIKVADIAISDDALGSITISLLGADAAAFEVEGTVLYLKAGTSLNYESKSAYAVAIVVGDSTIGGSSPVSTEYSLAVTDVNEAPTAVALSATAFDENIADGSLVATLTSTDFETSPQSFTYSLVAGAGDTDNLAFYITGNELHITRSPDYERKSTYNIRLKTSDQGGLNFDRNLQLSVNDLPDSASYSFSTSGSVVFEGSAIAIGISSQNVAPATKVYWSLSGTAITGSDVTDGILSGTTTLGADGRASFIKTIATDGVIEGDESVEIKFFSDSSRTQQLGSTFAVTLKEPSVGFITDSPDIITGTAASETITGIPVGSTFRGKGTVDKLTGGAGNDLFLLGDSQGVFYDDGNSIAQSTLDLAWITDFTSGDKIGLHGSAVKYQLMSARYAGFKGVQINALLSSSTPEPIGFVQNATLASLSLADSNKFTYF
jgi:hypothetical protein